MEDNQNNVLPNGEEQLRELFREAPIGITVIKCPELTILMANKKALGINKSKWIDVKGKSWYEVFPELAAQGFDKIIRQVMMTGEVYSANEMPINVLRNGKQLTHYISFSYQPIKNKSGVVTSITATGIDVTEFVISRQKIVESESKYRGLFESMNQAFAIIEVAFNEDNKPVDYKFIEINPAFEKITGLKNAVGKSAKELIPGIEEFWINTYGKVAITGESINFTHDSSQLGQTYDVHAYKIDKTTKIAILFNDSSERKKEEQRRQNFSRKLELKVSERTAELKSVNEDLKRFAHIASHDLREPVRKITTFNSLIKDEFGDILPERALGFLARIDNSANRIKSMIDGVHDYMSGDILVTNFEPVNLNEVVDNVRHDLRKLIQHKNAQFKISELPTIDGIPALINRLFCNLLHNALKFSNSAVEPVISINYTPLIFEETELAHITISDNGIGFDPIYSEKIFEPFTTLNPKDKFEGAGIGLAFCRKILKWHNGTITATAKLDEGATFQIIIPYNQVTDEK